MRKTARENAFKLIFERLINGSENKLSYAALTAAMNDDDKQFLDALLKGVFLFITKSEMPYSQTI